MCMLQLREQHKFKGDDVESIHVGLNHLAEALIAQPHAEKWAPKDPVTARFSLPYVISVAAAKGEVGIADLRTEAFADPTVRRILAATTVDIDAEIDRTHGLHQNSPTKVRVRLKGGDEHSIRVDKPFGHPDNPASLADGAKKLRACAEMSARPFPESRLQAISDFVADLERQPTLEPLVRLLVAEGAETKR